MQTVNDAAISELMALLSDDDEKVINQTGQGLYVGMMSGTSLDGIDVVLCRFFDGVSDGQGSSSAHLVKLVATHTQHFDEALKAALLALCTPDGIADLPKTHDDLVSELDYFGHMAVRYSQLAAQAVHELLQKAGVSADEVVAMGVHGQTVRHRPELGFSLQLLDPNVLAHTTGISVVSDFRRRDMAVGGQGAPLVPAFHQAMFAEVVTQGASVVLNLGGVANITILGDNVVGYDTGVANLLMDAWTDLHLGKPFDKDGAWAQSGTIHQALLERLLTHPFLAQSAPKSTGREAFNLAWLQAVLMSFMEVNPADVQATLAEFTAISAATEIAKFAQETKNTLYVCGGGAYNGYLLARLAHHLSAWQVLTTQAVGLAPTWVEATAFAWLARQNLLGRTGNMPSVTGASSAVVLGQICFA